MSMLAIRISTALKKEMNRTKINWSEYLRQSISEALDSERKKRFFQKVHGLGVRRAKTSRGTAAFLIRHMRDHG